MRKRGDFAVVRIPNFSTTNDDYYFSLLMLLLPHRCESELVGSYATAKDAFLAKHSLLDFSMHMYNSFLQQVEHGI
jgi:hypothetical protein